MMKRVVILLATVLAAMWLVNGQEVHLDDTHPMDDLNKVLENGEKHTFQAEVNRLMQLLINSLYTNKEIFLRELISNGSDALDKIKYLSLTNASLLEETNDDGGFGFEILIKADPDERTIRIADRGIGMSRTELINNLGTIAKSGTVEFMDAMKQKQAAKKQAAADSAADSASSTAAKPEEDDEESRLIGKFGVGFYSSFLVADKVVVVSQSADKNQPRYVWESDASGSFTVAEDTRDQEQVEKEDVLKGKRGTEVILHLKDTERYFTDQQMLKDIIHRYSQFISWPIKLWTSQTVQKQVEMTPEEIAAEANAEPEEAAEEDEEEIKVQTPEEQKEEEKQEEKKYKTVSVEEWGWEVMNDVKPIWMRSPKSITEEEYTEFYKALAKGTDDEAPLTHIHFKAEGDLEFRALLFAPRKFPRAVWDPTQQSSKNRIKLFVRHVFVTGDFSEIVPPAYRWLRGVVDSDDLPINVGREAIQESKNIEALRKKLVRKAVQMIQDLFKTGEDWEHGGEKYQQFYEEYSTALKVACIEDTDNRERLSKVLLFKSSKLPESNWTTFSEYLERLEALNKGRKNKQREILFLAGESLEAVKSSPLLERLVRNGHEVLYLTDSIDEYLMMHLNTFKGTRLTNIAKEGVKLDFMIDEEKEKENKAAVEDMASWMQRVLAVEDHVEKVVASSKLTMTPAAVVSSAWGPTANQQRLMKAQTLGAGKENNQMNLQKVLEINPGHPLIKDLHKKYQLLKDETEESEAMKELKTNVKLLFHTALLNSGYPIREPIKFSAEIFALLGNHLGVNPQEQVQEVVLEKPIEPEEEPAQETTTSEPTDKTEL